VLHVQLEVVVHALQNEWQVTDRTLDDHPPRVRITGQHTGSQKVGYRMRGVEGDVGRSGGLHRTTAHHVLADLVEVLTDIATAGVEMNRQSVFCAGFPQNVPRSVRKRLETVLLRDSGDDDPLVADRSGSLGFLGGGIWIPKRDVGQRYEALRRHADP